MPARPSSSDNDAASKERPTRRDERKEATRREIIAATIAAIADGGLADLTLSRITERAAVSRGLVNFHFDSKEQLLVETLKFLTLEYLQSWQQALAAAGGRPQDRLNALIENDFHPSICNREKVAVWFAFRGESKSRPTYLEVCNRADIAYDTAMREVMTAIRAEGAYDFDVPMIVAGLQSQIEGLWLDCLMYPESFDRVRAANIVKTFLSALMPRHVSRPA